MDRDGDDADVDDCDDIVVVNDDDNHDSVKYYTCIYAYIHSCVHTHTYMHLTTYW